MVLLLAKACATASSSSSFLSGLGRKSTAPAFIARTHVGISPWLLMKTIGNWQPAATRDLLQIGPWLMQRARYTIPGMAPCRAIRQTKLAFDDLVNQFNAAQNTPGVEESLETKHWSHAAFYPPVILFDDVVQVGTISNLDGIGPTVIELVIHAHAPQSGMGGLEAIQGNDSRLAVAFESFYGRRPWRR